MRNRLFPIALLAASFVFLGGCSSFKNSAAPDLQASGKMYAVKVDSTPFFHYGPQQGNGPTEVLKKDVLMTLVRPSFGYCKVKLTSGQDGYVANEDIAPAPPALIAALTAPPPMPQVAPTPGADRFQINSADPRLVAPPEPLPNPDLPPVAPPTP